VCTVRGMATRRRHQIDQRPVTLVLAFDQAAPVAELPPVDAPGGVDSGGVTSAPRKRGSHEPEFRSWWAFAGVLAGGDAGQRVAFSLTGPKTWAHD
jgi:hypothetical protein